MAKPLYSDGGKSIYGFDLKFMTLPIVNLPADAVSVRRRMGPKEIPSAHVTTADGCVSGYLLEPVEGGLALEKYASVGMELTQLPPLAPVQPLAALESVAVDLAAVVYTDPKLVKTGQRIMAERKAHSLEQTQLPPFAPVQPTSALESVAVELARRLPALQQDSPENNAHLIANLLRQALNSKV